MLTSTMTQETASHPKEDKKKDQAVLLDHLTTESQNEASQGFDTKSAVEIARIIELKRTSVAEAHRTFLAFLAITFHR